MADRIVQVRADVLAALFGGAEETYLTGEQVEVVGTVCMATLLGPTGRVLLDGTADTFIQCDIEHWANQMVSVGRRAAFGGEVRRKQDWVDETTGRDVVAMTGCTLEWTD